MSDYHQARERIEKLLREEPHAGPLLEREHLRTLLNEIQRISAHACLLIDQEIIRELKDLRRQMPEHGFTAEPAPRLQAATIEDLLA